MLWTDSTTDPPVLYRLERGVSRPLWRGREVALPAGEPPGSEVVQTIAGLGASATAAGFVYRVGVLQPRPISCEICYRDLFSELWVGPPHGPFRRVRGVPGRCGQIDGLDAGPRSVVVSEAPSAAGCTELRPVFPKVVSVPLAGRGRQTVFARSSAFRFVHVAAAGRYVAWDRLPMRCGAGRIPCSRTGITVYDMTRRRVAFRLSAKQLGVSGAPSFSLALQPDGKLAVVASGATKPCAADLCNHGRLAWASPSSPRPHVVAAAPLDYPVAMSGDRLVFLTDDSRALEVSDLRGRTRALDPFEPSRHWFDWTLDAGGGRVLWTAVTAPGLPAPLSAYSTSIFVAPLR